MTRQGNQHAVIHGGAGALDAVQNKKPFSGIATAAQERVRSELLATGPGGQVEKDAERLQTCADLYFDAILAAFAVGELDKADSYIKVFGWLVSSSLRAWLEVRRIGQDSWRVSAQDVIDAITADQKAKEEAQNGAG